MRIITHGNRLVQPADYHNQTWGRQATGRAMHVREPLSMHDRVSRRLWSDDAVRHIFDYLQIGLLSRIRGVARSPLPLHQ